MKHILEASFENILSNIYQAPTNPTLWSNVLSQIGEPVQSDIGHLVVVEKDNPALSFSLLSGIDGQSLYDGFAWYVEEGACTRSNHDQFAPSGSVTTDYSHLDERSIKHDQFYQDFCKKFGIDYYAGLILAQEPQRFIAIGTYRAKRYGNFSEEEVRYLRRLTPHLQRSVEIMRMLGLKGAVNGLVSANEELPSGFITLDNRGKIVSMNNKAWQILARGDGVSQSGQHLKFADKNAQKRFELELKAISKQILGDIDWQSNFFHAKRATSHSPYICYTSPLRLEEDYFNEIAGCVYIMDPDNHVQDLKPLLINVLKLTNAEAGLVEFLCQGKSLRDYAEYSGVSINAPRFHLKNIFQKLNVNRQSELVSLVLKAAASFPSIK